MGEHMDRQFFDEIVLRTSALEALKERQADMGIPENENPPEEEIREFLLQDDKLRANIMEYNGPMLDDINGGGHWELWPYEGAENIIKLDSALVARDPESSILDGVVGIDFGTKSTVVVQQGETNQSMPMRVGIGDYRKKPEAHHYENPTILARPVKLTVTFPVKICSCLHFMSTKLGMIHLQIIPPGFCGGNCSSSLV